MSEMKQWSWGSRCAECGDSMPAGVAQRCAKGGYCSWRIPSAANEVMAEMYEALEAVLPTHCCDTGEADYKAEWDGDHTVCEVCRPAYAAIAKAEGRQ